VATDLAFQAAHSSTSWSERGGALAQAESIRARALELAAEVEETYGAAMAALMAAREHPGLAGHPTDAELGEILAQIVALLLRLGETATDAAELAETVARSGEAVGRSDAIVATMLAAAAADICAHLVDVNLLIRPEDERSRTAHELLASTVRSREAARATSG
jgi:formiminotetrahydrofolate cyclodeaminase